MPQFFGQIDAVYTSGGANFWAHPAGGAPGLPPDRYLNFPGGGASATVATHAKATGSNVWLIYTVDALGDGTVSDMYVF
jgi:hypothetical protein